MKYTVNGSETAFGRQVTSQLGTTDISRSVMPEAGGRWRSATLFFNWGSRTLLPRSSRSSILRLYFSQKLCSSGSLPESCSRPPPSSQRWAPFCGGVPCFRN